MGQPRNFEQVISSLRAIGRIDEIPVVRARKISEDLESMLTSEEALRLLKQHPNHFEVVLPLFIRIIFHPNHEVAQPCLKRSDVMLEIYRDKLPKIRASFKEFEQETFLDLIESLKPRVEANDEFWVAIWTFACDLLTSDIVQVATLNKLLNITEAAYKNKSNKDRVKIIEKAWVCWRSLIDAFGRNPKILNLEKTINLLMRPLLSFTYTSESKIGTWIHLIEVKRLSGSVGVIKSVVEPMLSKMYKHGEKSLSRNSPDGCINALIKILVHDHVIAHCLTIVIDVFGACVNSRPSASLIEQLAAILIQAINDFKDDGGSYKLWKALLEQYKSCTESPILSRACQNIFADVFFLRWLDSSTIEGKDITELMTCVEFREKVLLRSIKALTFDEQVDTPSKKKSRKGSYEDVWSTFCEAYISWLSDLSPPSPKETEKPEAIQYLKDNCDYQAVQFLLMQPIHLNMWNPTVCKTWTLLCGTCHSHKFLHTFVKAIFDSLCEPNFQVQKAIDVSDCLYKLDNSFCKQSTKVLDHLSSTIFSLEFHTLLDVLNLLEVAVNYPEMFSLLTKICKNANDKSADYDQLNAHKIRTKVSKITRKLEQLSNSAEKDKPAKVQRAPFRAQSNFLQRLAKAEGKNKVKSPFLTSMFSNSEKGKNGLENGDDGPHPDATSVNCSHENGVNDNYIKPTNDMEDSENVPMITLPSVLKKSPAKTNGHTLEVVAAKEMVLPTVNGVSPVASPKMKITNAREVKTVDSSSPAATKKPKPIAGLKTTPKKLTPSKVSYFDDDANDCVMVPPKLKTTPLTEHQMEMMSKRRTDIPALYQDLSQDTQSQKIGVILEVTTGVSPKTVRESEDIVPGTPSPDDFSVISAPEHRKSTGKTSTSAKRLDFTNLSSPPSKSSLMDGSVREIPPKREQLNSDDKTNVELSNGLIPTHSSVIKDEKLLVNGLSCSEEPVTDTKDMGVLKQESHSSTEEKSKRKRKSEPIKFSPKLTRSKRNLKNATPDAKLTKLPAPDAKSLLVAKSPDPSVRSGKPLSPHTDAESDEANPAEPNAESVTLLGTPKSSVPQICSTPIKLEPSVPPSEISGGIKQPPSVENISCDVVALSNDLHGSPMLSSQLADEVLPSSQSDSIVTELLSQDKPKKGRKRKTVEISNTDTPKKVKTSEEVAPSSAKKSGSTKKKKPVMGSNLENWLLKTERVPTPLPEQEVKIEKTEPCNVIISEPEKADSESVPNETGVYLDSSEEIVPNTQESTVENHISVLPVLETKADKCSEELIVKTQEEDRAVVVIGDSDSSSPDKNGGSVLERLSQESPNDDIDLIISPSKRQRRASSVFRGEGDTYLTKEKFYSAPSDDAEEEMKLARSKKSASPTSKKRLQLGGRSARMLRLAASSSSNSAQEDNEEVIVTPSRRRESIAPVKYGENWPKGATEEWVACTPLSPYMSPFRSALKKTPGLEENTTPQRNRNEMASPLLSSAKRKRVVFLDPPVTRGLLYDLDSPGGSIHHADVPLGSPYPTWKGEDNPATMEVSPSKSDTERLNSLAALKTDCVPEDVSPAKRSKGQHVCAPLPCNSSDMSEEVRQLIDQSEPTNVPSPEPDMNQLQEKFQLSDDFVSTLSEADPHIRSLLIQCFDCTNMKKTVGSWKFEDCILVNHMPRSFLLSVRNVSGEVITDLLSAFYSPPQTSVCSSQTEQKALAENFSQTPIPPLSSESHTQTTVTSHRTVEINTESAITTSSSTQADQNLPVADELPSILDKMTTQQCFSLIKNVLSFCEKKLPD